MEPKNKEYLFYTLIIISVIISIYFTYERAFIKKSFEVIQSEDIQDSTLEVINIAQ